jgi:hypothetical protein
MLGESQKQREKERERKNTLAREVVSCGIREVVVGCVDCDGQENRKQEELYKQPSDILKPGNPLIPFKSSNPMASATIADAHGSTGVKVQTTWRTVPKAMDGDTINAHDHHERQFLFRNEKQSNHAGRSTFM